MTSRLLLCLIVLAALSFSAFITLAQGSAAPIPHSTDTAISTDYPVHRAGMFIRSSDWISLPPESPAKSRVKHGLAPAFTYGAVAAVIVSEYKGPHAQVRIQQAQPIICVCHFVALPGVPVLVRLHEKKKMRELDGGRIRIGAKMEEAQKSDFIPANVSKPEDMVWLIQPQQALAPGEYALMLGTQNIMIYPFTIQAANVSMPAGQR